MNKKEVQALWKYMEKGGWFETTRNDFSEVKHLKGAMEHGDWEEMTLLKACFELYSEFADIRNYRQQPKLKELFDDNDQEWFNQVGLKGMEIIKTKLKRLGLEKIRDDDGEIKTGK